MCTGWYYYGTGWVCAHLELGQLDDAALCLAPVRRRQRAGARARAGRRAVPLPDITPVTNSNVWDDAFSILYLKPGIANADQLKR